MRSFGLPELLGFICLVFIIIIVGRKVREGLKSGSAMVGALVGAFIGFMLRPSVPLIGQLPLGIVLTRGAYLTGLEVVLTPVAQQSFGYMVVGAVLGAVGFIVAQKMFVSPSSPAPKKSVLPSVVPQPSAMADIFCTACGVGFKGSATFCGGCGAKRA